MDKYKNRKKLFFLCGFMACGKTSIAKCCCNITGYKFFDTDEMIERLYSMEIKEIFNLYGEKIFRNMENEISEIICGYDYSIISLGGGFILNPYIAQKLRDTGYIVYIKRNIDDIYEDIKEDCSRPVLYKKTYEEARELYEQRIKIYEKYSDYTINNVDIDYSIRKLSEYINSI